MTEHLLRVRAETGTSSFGVLPHLMDAFEPVIGQLAGAVGVHAG